MTSLDRSNRLAFRVLLSFVLLFLAVWLVTLLFGVGINQVMRFLGASYNVRVFLGSTLSRGGMLVGVLVLSALALRKATGLRASEVMFPRHRGWLPDLLFGLGLAAVVMVILFGIEVAAGWVTPEDLARAGQPADAWLRAVWLSLLTNLLAAAGEEAMYRGFLLTGLVKAWGQRIGLLVMALLFALPHLTVAGAGQTHWALFTVLLALPGMMLGWAYLRAGSLWLPVGVHFAWNMVQDDLLNLSGTRAGDTPFGLVVQRDGPEWVTGTSYGIETGIAGIAAVLVCTLGIWLWTRSRIHGEHPA